MTDSPNYGLLNKTLTQLREIFAQFPVIEEVILYGSRARGDYRQGSDIDLTIKGQGLDLAIMSKIYFAIDDLLLPYSVDLSNYDHIDNENLLQQIDQEGKTIFQNRKAETS